MKRLDGKVAIVTGSTQGLGEGIAHALAQEGARVVVNGRSREKGERVLASLRALGAEAEFIAADLSRKSEVLRLVAETVDRFGGLDILINNAQTISPSARLEDEGRDEAFAETLQSGLYASLWAAQAALPYLKACGGGRIVNFASINGFYGARWGAHYNATKEAIRGLTRTQANEWGRHGITVNVVLPAGWSPAYAAFYEGAPERAEAVAKLNPMRRHGRAEEDIGAAVLGLVADTGRYITGQSLFIDGGAHLLGLPQLHSLSGAA